MKQPITPKQLAELRDLTQDLVTLSQRHIALAQEMERTVNILAFDPHAFVGGGRCRIGGAVKSTRGWEGTITLTRADGTETTYSAADVPFVIWPKHMQADLLATPKHRRPPGLRSQT